MYLNVTPRGDETHPYKKALIIKNDLFGKCSTNLNHRFRQPAYMTQLESGQVCFWPTMELACMGRSLVASFGVEKMKRMIVQKLSGQEKLKIKQKHRLAECKDYLKHTHNARKALGIEMEEMKYLIRCKNYKSTKNVSHPDIRYYQTQVTHCMFVDDPQIEVGSNSQGIFAPNIRSEFDMVKDVFCNLTTPTTIYFGVNNFSSKIQYGAMPVGIACSYLLQGAGALLLRKYRKARSQSVDHAICREGLRCYQWNKFLNKFIESLPTNEKKSLLAKLKVQEQEFQIPGSDWYKGNKEIKLWM